MFFPPEPEFFFNQNKNQIFILDLQNQYLFVKFYQYFQNILWMLTYTNLTALNYIFSIWHLHLHVSQVRLRFKYHIFVYNSVSGIY